MYKQEAYKKLVEKRKAIKHPSYPSQIEGGHDCEHINAWSQWQNDLDAKILVVGQHFGTLKYFIDNEGKYRENNKTNKNLTSLFASIGIDISKPKKLFFTNAILGMHNPKEVPKEDVALLGELVKIIEPAIIITLGDKALYSVCKNNKELFKLYDNNKNDTLCDKIKKFQKEIKLNDKKIFLFACYSPDEYSLLNILRVGKKKAEYDDIQDKKEKGLALQKADWEKIGAYLRDNNISV